MPRFRSLVSSLLSITAASGAVVHQNSVRNSKIQWGPCPESLNATIDVTCAKLPVPLDYTNSSSTETLELNLIRYPAQNGPSKGTILLNFGGPGQDGLTSMLTYAPIQSA